MYIVHHDCFQYEIKVCKYWTNFIDFPTKKTIKIYQEAIVLNIHATWIHEEVYLRSMMWKLVVNLIRK